MGIDDFNDLVVSNALVRPGALLSQGQRYIDCKKGNQKPSYPHEVVKDILEETYGTVIFQEQLMQMAVKLSGFTWSEADKLRKIIGKKRDAAEFDQFKDKFVSNSIIPKKQAEKMWSEFEMAALYMFNKSHAVAYSMLSYQTMWLKVNYPAEYIWSLLYNEEAQDKITAYLMEAGRYNVNIFPPDVNLSDESFTIQNGDIRFGLRNVLGCGLNAIKEIVTNRPYSSIEEFNAKCSKRYVKAPLRENLDKIGAFSSTGHISEFQHERYYLPILGFGMNMGKKENEIDEFVESLKDFHEINSPIRLVKAVVRSTKKTPKYLRVELEDEEASTTVFCDRNTEIANRDFIYAFIGDRTMHLYCDAYEYEESEIQSFVELMAKGKDHEYSWLYNHDIGDAKSEKSLLYVFSTRTFITSKEKVMGNVYCWDGSSIIKIVIFPSVYKKLSFVMGKTGWYAAKLNQVKNINSFVRLDSFTLLNENSLISVEDYISRKRIVRMEYA
jgi:DNA polymerase-3 subunit alpha